MAQYVFPCIITETKNSNYSLFLPDFDKTITNEDLYDLLIDAQSVLLLEIYIREIQRVVIAKPTKASKIQLEQNQFTSFIACDTDSFSNILSLYDNIQTEDLITYLENKTNYCETTEERIEVESASVYEEVEPDKTNELDEQNIITDNESTFDIANSYIEDIEVKQPEPVQMDKSETNEIEIPAPPELEIPEPPEQSNPNNQKQYLNSAKPRANYRKSNYKKKS